MTKQVAAVFEQGVLRPLEPFHFAEREHLFLTVSDLPTPTMVRVKERTWLDRNGVDYAGQWVALQNDTLLSHGANAIEVQEKAWSRGVEAPFLIHIPPAEPELPLGGW